MKFGGVALALVALASALPAAAQEAAKADKPREAPIPAPLVSVTRHAGNFGGQAIRYVATTGETYLKDAAGEPTAAIFSTSYVKEGRDPDRPITFLFNGGPGSGSVWLHMGAFGPKRVVVPSEERDDGAPPFP
ncbi:MAG: peptidase S10, partial [Sphingomonadaceae bacterium]|nr:peptidase S10 [Sphingomonadaceae bacterium]